MLTLGIDTSNYATSLAVFDTQAEEVVCAVKKFLPVKPGERGLRQSDAVFHHTAALPELMAEVAKQADLSRVGAVGVSERPRPVEGSYMPCFLTGVSAAAAFGYGAGVPVIRTTHQQGHVAAAVFAAGGAKLFGRRLLVFHISGGTTDLLLCEKGMVLKQLGTSTDLYAGQAVDRIGVRMGFAFPAGEEVSKIAAECTESIRPKVSVQGMNCSLSGLENQCDALLKKGKPNSYVAKYCLCAIGAAMLKMIEAARKEYPGLPVVAAGGVMSSDIVRREVTARCRDIYFVPGKFASDNAIGTAILAANGVGAWPIS